MKQESDKLSDPKTSEVSTLLERLEEMTEIIAENLKLFN
jgi:hypothetical protein